MAKKNHFTRRKFIRDSSMVALGSAILPGTGRLFAARDDVGSDVVLVRNLDVLDKDGVPRYDVVLKMLDSAVTALTGSKEPAAAWKQFINPRDILGIKSNVWRYLPTPPQVEQAIKKRALDVGVPGENIKIEDRGLYGNEFFLKATALINTRPMRTHYWSGVGSCLKNMITFVPSPRDYHPDSCADLAKVWFLPAVKGKVRLNVLVMFTPQFHGIGPHNFNPKYVWRYHGLIAGVDPVAVDAVGVRIIEAKRKEYFGEDKPLNPPAKHISLAETRHKLGFADPSRINLLRIGDSDNILI